MKSIFLMVCLLSASAAFSQNYVGYLNSEPQVYHAPDHPAHASYAPIAQETSIVGGGAVSIATGEKPASDFPQKVAMPLGDAARELKKQHAQVKKARKVWEN
jgi:hypothetical protein